VGITAGDVAELLPGAMDWILSGEEVDFFETVP